MIVCFLACVKSGHAYCPIDISVPASRVAAIVDEVAPPCILSTEPFPFEREGIVTGDEIAEICRTSPSEPVTLSPVLSDDVFYIIFTSGSTGTPKGVQITCECLDNYLMWAKTLGGGLDPEKHYTFINQAPFSFDLSVMDLYLSLFSGGTLAALDKAVQSSTAALFRALEKSSANVWVSTPSFADVCLSDERFSEALLPQLEKFLFCGETLTNRTAGELMRRFPKAVVVNTYGPTESTVAVTEVNITPEVNAEWSPLPVGREKPGTRIFIMDEAGRILRDGEKGEIVIAGDTVSIGYLNKPELTEKVFGTYEIDGKSCRLYHTGDKGYRQNGWIFYCGRLDFQIKLHGYRIELEDIESNIMKLPGVRQAAVLPVYRDGQVRSISAYVAADRSDADDFQYSQKLRSMLRKYVPDYMIPKKFVFVDALPRTDNGKVDRRALGGMRA